jgi:hypothetical protein
MYACRDGHAHVVEILLAHCASYDMKDQNGWTASQYGQNFPDVVAILEQSAVKRRGVWVGIQVAVFLNFFLIRWPHRISSHPLS